MPNPNEKTEDIQTLIEELQKLQRLGAKMVKYEGTLYAPEYGNYIILSTDPYYNRIQKDN